uniref:Uncharacterized protein n=1 Tax=Arundo donax TaxID=35708 RepID=A0A0A9DI08_ARUDO
MIYSFSSLTAGRNADCNLPMMTTSWRRSSVRGLVVANVRARATAGEREERQGGSIPSFRADLCVP